MSYISKFDRFQSVAFQGSILGHHDASVAERAVPAGDDGNRIEGGPRLFRCLLVCAAISLPLYGVAGWLLL